MRVAVYILVMTGVTYLIRAIPFTLFRRKIKSPFFRSFFHYIPYAVLTAMTIPDIFYSTNDFISAAAGTLVAALLAWFRQPLIVVALAASAAALGMGFIL